MNANTVRVTQTQQFTIRVSPKCTDLLQLAENGEGDGHHHSGSSRVRDPHGYESGHGANTAEQFRVAAPERLHHNQSDSQMQIAVLGGDGENQAPDEDHDGVVHVTDTCFLGAKNAEHRKQHDGYQRRDRDWYALCHPVTGQEQHNVSASDFLREAMYARTT